MSDPSPTALDQYRLLGRSGLRVSPLCLGTMTFGADWGWGADADTSKAMFDAYVDRGGNYIDTANFYTNGTSEKLLADFIAGDREWFVIGTKYTLNTRRGDPNAGGNHRKNMAQAVEASLKRLGTDYIDVYWLHAWDFTTPADEVMRGLDDLVRSGKVLYLGVSDTPAWKIAQCNTIAEIRGWSKFVTMQMHYHLALRDCERDLLPFGIETGIPMQPWSPLGGGTLTGKYTREDLKRQQEQPPTDVDAFDTPNRLVGLSEKKMDIADAVQETAKAIGRTSAQVALNWVLHRPGVVSPIIGARTLAQLEDNLGCLEFTLDDEHRERLDKVSAIPLGFPHDMIGGAFVRDIITGGTVIR